MLEFIVYTVVISLILAGIGFSLQYGMKAEIEQRQCAKSWPKTTGTVLHSKTEEHKRKMVSLGAGAPLRILSLNRFKPVITYTYEAGGKQFESSKYKNGMISRSGEWTSLIPKTVEKIIAEHPHGKTVTVTYNPEEPSLAYLELDTSAHRQQLIRLGGFLLLIAAAGLFLMGAYRVGETLVTREKMNDIPALVPAITEDIKNGLTQDLGLTCQLSKTNGGQEISYENWHCKNQPGTGVTNRYVSIYNRELAPAKVDSIHALTGEPDTMKELEFFLAVVKLAIPAADPQLVLDWMVKTEPTLTEMGNKAEMDVSGVKLVLSNPNGIGIVMKIGEIK